MSKIVLDLFAWFADELDFGRKGPVATSGETKILSDGCHYPNETMGKLAGWENDVSVNMSEPQVPRHLPSWPDRAVAGPNRSPFQPTPPGPRGPIPKSEEPIGRNPVDELLHERGEVHGDFTDNAYYAQEFKRILRLGKNWDKMSAWSREASEMIVHKIARALAGQWDEPDHWDDMAGYAKLTADRCRRRRGGP